MSDDGLFADLRPVPHQPQVVEAGGLADWQVNALRKALDQAGAATTPERQRLIEELAGRPVPTLRDLSILEARTISEALAARNKPANGTGSTWDDRDADTWIDRL